ncbi:MAG: helix-turn-helix domain-containing protein [Anaerolineae bacterium]
METQQLLSDSFFTEPDLPLAVHLTHQADLRHHMHTFIELVMVVEGSGTHVFRTERYPITVGDVFVIPPYTPHGYVETEDLTIYNILFKESMFSRYREELELIPGFHGLIYLEPYYRSVRGFAGRLSLTPDQIVRATSLVNRLELEWNAQQEGRRIMVENLFIELLLFYCRRFSVDAGPSNRVMPVARVIGFMNRHFAETLLLDDLVQVAGLSKRSLIRHFKNTTGLPPMRYLQKIRIAKARMMLKRGDQSITQVAMDSGFNDSAYFSTVFKKHTGQTPSEFQTESATA